MSTGTINHIVKYKGGGGAGTIYNIPFPFDVAASLKVRVVSSSATPTNKTERASNDYVLTGMLSNSTQTVFTDAAADFGWIEWKAAATSTTDTIEIYREEPVTTSTNHGAWSSSTNKVIEREMDKLSMSLSRNCKRSETDPLVYDALNRSIKGLADPARGDDALNDTVLNIMDAVTPSLTVGTSSSGSDYWVTPSGYASGSGSGSITYGQKIQMPTISSPSTPARPLVSEDDGARPSPNYSSAWTAKNWIPTAPNDGNGYFLKSDISGNYSWAKVYEVPMSSSGDTNDVVSYEGSDVLGWRTLSEAPYSSNANTKSNRFVVHSGGSPAWGPRFKHGTVESNNIEIAALSSMAANPGCHNTNIAFDFNPGMLNDSGSAVVPDHIFLTVETEKCDSDGGAQTFIPMFSVRLLRQDSGSSKGFESATDSHGQLGYLNVNDGLTSNSAHDNYCDVFSQAVVAGDDLDVKIHWLAVWDS